MYNLTDEQIDFISNDITKRGIETEDVRDNILDHVCCIIEHEMSLEEDFYVFYEQTIARFYTRNLREIEEETKNLITFKYYYAMRRTLKITAIATSLLIISGGIFKFQHWPGAAVLLFSGLILFSLVFLPLNIILKFRDDQEKENRMIMLVGFLTASVGTIGILFKVMHWPTANILFYGSFIAFLVLFIPLYFYTKFRQTETKFTAIMNTTFMIAACGMLFALVNLRSSVALEESVLSMDTFQLENIHKLENANALVYSAHPELATDRVKMISAELNTLIKSISSNLISKSNGEPDGSSGEIGRADLKNPNDSKVVTNEFENAKGELSFDGLKEKVGDYNKIIAATDPSLIQIDISKLQMTNTIVSVVLHQLLDIEMLVLTSEQSYLRGQRN